MKTYWGVEAQIHAFLTWTLDSDEWLGSHFGSSAPGRAPGTNWIGV